jgi:hypothetical protein
MGMTSLFVSVEVGQPIPADGEFELLRDGKVVGAVTFHPRIPGYWMAFTSPKDWRDAGMKKYATRNGAVRRVLRAVT